MNALQESPKTVAFRQWLQNNGAYIHPSVIFAPGKYGSSVFTTTPLEEDCKIVSCPFDLIITTKVAQDALQSLSTDACPLSDRDALCTYLVLHSETLHGKLSGSKGPDWISARLRHQEYIDTLPQDGIMTPLFFTEQEMGLLHGTNLYHATIDRKREWHTGWQRARQWLQRIFELSEDEFTWDHFLRAHTWLSSRAFPSSLMDDPPSLSSKNTVPILVPLVDALNHARNTPISWSVDRQEGASALSQVMNRSLSLVSHKRTESLEEIFNNYGAKPNDELLLGYGFTLANNPEDVLLLKLPGSERRFKIIRAALGLGEAQAVWNEIGRRLQEGFATDEDDLDVAFAELQLEIGQILPEMLRDLKAKLPLAAAFDPSLPGIRPEVREMVWNYVEGQRGILDDILAFAETQLKAAIESAQELGIDIALEPDDGDSG